MKKTLKRLSVLNTFSPRPRKRYSLNACFSFKSRGFILISSYFLLLILAISVLTLSQTIYLQLKLLSQAAIHQQKLARLEKAAADFVAHRQSIVHDPSIQLTWQTVGIYPCLLIKKEEQLLSSQLFLLSAFYDEHSPRLALRIAVAVPRMPCKLNPRIIREGLISWQYH